MKKRISGLVMCFMLAFVSLFAGCNLFTTDANKYYSTIVATAVSKSGEEETIEITKKELIIAYNNYGYYYEYYYSYEREEAIEMTLNLLISRKITLREAESMFTLSEKELTYLWTETNDSLEDNLLSYVDDILGTSDDEEEESSDGITFEGYTKSATLVNLDGTYSIKKNSTTEDTISGFSYTTARNIEDDTDKQLIYSNLVDLVVSSGTTYQKAFSNYLSDLISSEEGQKLSTKTEEVFLREIDRIYTELYESYMITKYSEYYQSDSEIASVSVDQILAQYEGKVKSSYTQYVIEGDDGYEDDVLDDVSSVYYFLEGDDDTKFYYVSHILLQFSDEQSEAYSQAETDLENGKITQAQYEQIISDLYDEIVPTVREKNSDGVYVEVDSSSVKSYEKSASSLLSYIQTQIASASTAQAKAEIFNEYIYKYNDDTGIQNAEYNYVMGLNKSEGATLSEGDDGYLELDDGRVYKSYSNMVDEFTEAGALLYNDGQGEIGDLSGLVYSEYGIHIIFYAGACENLFEGINTSWQLGTEAIEVLNSARLNICVDKTWFDVIYDELVTDNFSYFESLNLEVLKGKYNITYIKNGYSDLLD